MHRPVILILNFLMLSGCAQVKKSYICNASESVRAENEIVLVTEWNSMQEFYYKFSNCDDGSVAEGISDRVGYLLTEKFLDFLKGARLNRFSNDFVKFVVRHIDESQQEDQLRTILERSKFCTEEDARLCNLLHARAQAAVDNL